MPLPLIPIIFGAASAAAAAHGVKKGIEAKNDLDAAKSINSEAQKIAKNAEKSINTAKDETTKAIENLGAQKIATLGGSINDFVTTFEKIRNIDFEDSAGLDELKHFNPSSPEFLQLKKVSVEAKTVAVNGIGALGGGALLAFGTYNVVMSGLGGLLVTATTGTTLASLTGVAATNATLAWLGGGALAAGGFGMVGGMAVLGGLVAGPALALGGSLFAKQADKAYWDAQSNRENAKKFAEQAKSINTMLSAVKLRAEQLTNLLVNLDKPFNTLIADMRSIVRNQGVNWTMYSDADKKQIYKCVKVAQAVKMVLDTMLLNEDGKLTDNSLHTLSEGKQFLSTCDF